MQKNFIRILNDFIHCDQTMILYKRPKIKKFESQFSTIIIHSLEYSLTLLISVSVFGVHFQFSLRSVSNLIWWKSYVLKSIKWLNMSQYEIIKNRALTSSSCAHLWSKKRNGVMVERKSFYVSFQSHKNRIIWIVVKS